MQSSLLLTVLIEASYISSVVLRGGGRVGAGVRGEGLMKKGGGDGVKMYILVPVHAKR